jgi:thiol:disulfide interchange protein DsbG
MDRRRHLCALAGLTAAALAGCSKTEPTAPAPAGAAAAAAASAPDAQRAYAAAQATGSGFAVGALMAADPVIVFFDPQCPHCAELWKAAQPLLGRIRMVWMPVGFLRPVSAPQGALLLAAPDPVASMTAHEALLANRQGGLPVPEKVDEALLAKVRTNTELLGKVGADSVPFLLFRHRQSGAWGSHAGALATEPLAQLLGL